MQPLGTPAAASPRGALESPFLTSALDLLSWFQHQAMGSRAFLERCNHSYKSLSSRSLNNFYADPQAQAHTYRWHFPKKPATPGPVPRALLGEETQTLACLGVESRHPCDCSDVRKQVCVTCTRGWGAVTAPAQRSANSWCHLPACE